jgi:hypothetical protein
MATEIVLHALTSDHTGLMFIGTSKKRVYEFLVSNLSTKPKKASTYIEFAQLCQGNKITKVVCSIGVLYVYHVVSNNKIRADVDIFS